MSEWTPERVRELVERAGGPRPAARRMGSARQTLWKWYTGRKRPNTLSILKLAGLEAELGRPEFFCSSSHFCCSLVRDVQARLQARPRNGSMQK